MNRRNLALAAILLLTCLALVFTQGLAFSSTPQTNMEAAANQQMPDSSGFLKKTEKPNDGGGIPDKPDKPDKPSKPDKPDKPEKTKKVDKKDKPDKPSKTPKLTATPTSDNLKDLKKLSFRGTVAGVRSGSLDLNLSGGGSVSIDMDSNTRVHIPTEGGESSPEGLNTGVQVSVRAVQPKDDGNPLAISISVIPGKPVHIHHVGVVAAYEPGVSITIAGKNGPTTFSLAGVKILPDENALIEAGVTQVTIIFKRDVTGGPLTIQAIVVHPKENPYP